MREYYEAAIRTLEHRILQADPESDDCTKMTNLWTQMQIKQKLEKENPLSPERKERKERKI